MPSNYTEKEVNKMIDVYTANPCMETVEKLMTLLNRPKKSIISKLVKEGVYVTRGYRTKTGELPITKLDLVRSVEDALDLKLPGLDKAPKSTLKALSTTISELSTHMEEALDQVQELAESHRVLEEMLDNKKIGKREPNFYDPIATLGEDS
jgi:hypothetical protein